RTEGAPGVPWVRRDLEGRGVRVQQEAIPAGGEGTGRLPRRRRGVRQDLVEALVLIGPDAEEYVLPYLSSKSKEAGLHAAQSPSSPDTKKSLDALAKVATTYERDKNLAAAAKTAIGKIEEREKTPPKSDNDR